MNPALAPTDALSRQNMVDITTSAASTHRRDAARTACARIAPLWPLRHFVAVNPFLAETSQNFAQACFDYAHILGSRLVQPRMWYREALAVGRITPRDLAAAQAQSSVDTWRSASLAELSLALRQNPKPMPTLTTIEDFIDSHGVSSARVSTLTVDEISRWCAARFDEHQSAWQMPGRSPSLWTDWRLAMRHDRNVEVAGVAEFRATVAALPSNPESALLACLDMLEIPDELLDAYLFRVLSDIRGWAAYVRYRGWHSELKGERSNALMELLVIRLAFSCAFLRAFGPGAWVTAWQTSLRQSEHDLQIAARADLALDLLCQEAQEHAYQRHLIARLAGTGKAPVRAVRQARAPLQAVFCIDVRSEIYRRALEASCPRAETFGFAGFFGFPVEYVPLGLPEGNPQCPVLMTPRHTVCETLADADRDERQEVLGLRLLRRRAARAWKSFKGAAVTSFTYVETLGLLYAGKLLGDALGHTRPVADPATDGIDRRSRVRLTPSVESCDHHGRANGLALEERIALAESALRGMSLTEGFARLVLLVGHGSSSVNNPHASSLDCGACGGHSGEANARIAASVLNDPLVRGALAWRGIKIPDDTWFLGGLHDTTTDDVRLFVDEPLPDGHQGEFGEVQNWLKTAGESARKIRAGRLGIHSDTGTDASIRARSRDWSQVRPEWGLAGNAAFIAAPRAFTREIDLDGRAFLHTYDWHTDEGFATLELIMTAPMVVATWINFQYYASTIDNARFGAGNKVLHNVSAGIGVLEGHAGDLRTGLPWQSLHDGSRLMHEPLRLSVLLAAPQEAIDAILAKHTHIRELVDNRWIHLLTLDENGQVTHRRMAGGAWQSLDAST